MASPRINTFLYRIDIPAIRSILGPIDSRTWTYAPHRASCLSDADGTSSHLDKSTTRGYRQRSNSNQAPGIRTGQHGILNLGEDELGRTFGERERTFMQFVIRRSHLIGIYDPVAIQTAAGVFAGGSVLLIANFVVWMLWDLMRR